jgi:hypothetical protein
MLSSAKRPLRLQLGFPDGLRDDALLPQRFRAARPYAAASITAPKNLTISFGVALRRIVDWMHVLLAPCWV